MKRKNQIFLLSALVTGLHAEPTSILNSEAKGWKQCGPGAFSFEGPIATATGGMGMLWYEAKEYGNACFEVEFLAPEADDNSGIFVRFPDPGNDPWVAVKQGYEIQLAGTEPGKNKNSFGSIYDIQPAIKGSVKVGEWNTYKILTVGNKIAVIINDELINVFQCQPGRGEEKGYFGIQNHDDGSPVRFRSVKVHELSSGTLLEAMDELKIPRAELIEYQAKSAKGKGDKGPEWFQIADHGPAFFQTFGDWYDGKERKESAIKGALLSYSSDPNKKALFNTETLALVSATNNGAYYLNTPWAGGHGKVNQFLNKDHHLFNTTEGPVWADESGSFEDTRDLPGYGNFDHLDFKGYTRHGNRIILNYAVNGVEIHDSLSDHTHGMVRHLEVAPREKTLKVRLADSSSEPNFALKVSGKGASIKKDGDSHILTIAASPIASQISILYATSKDAKAPAPVRLHPMTKGGPGISPESFEVEPVLDDSDSTWLVDDIPLPPALKDSPYLSKVRMSDLDFFSDGDRALLPTWDGDIWMLSGLKDFKKLTWKRYATGFFEPLGLVIVDDVPHIMGRDGIWQTWDLNDDGEADRFEVFNNDILITNNFHEFQFGLETDSKGNFYTAKASPVLAGGRGFDKILPHNGAFVKISADGEKLYVIGTGLRAPGGIGVGPNGEITTGENEGTWQPCCKINFADPSMGTPFFGVENTRHENEAAFTEPLCYLPMSVDNSGGSQIWIPENAKIGIAPGEMLHLSYGKSAIYHVLPQKVRDGFYQGGVVKLPIKLASSAQRVDFHPDGSMYVVGFRGWQTNAAREAGVQRIRYNKEADNPLPVAMEVTKEGVKLTFDVELDDELATDPTSYTAERWKYVRSKQYGSGHFSVDNPDEEAEKTAAKKESQSHRVHDKVAITAAKLLSDKKSILLTVEGHKPSQQFKLDYDLESTDGKEMIGTIHSTIHEVPGS